MQVLRKIYYFLVTNPNNSLKATKKNNKTQLFPELKRWSFNLLENRL